MFADVPCVLRAPVANDVEPPARARRAPRFKEPGAASGQTDLFEWAERERPYVIGTIYSLCQVLRAIGGDPTSGQARLNLKRQIDRALLKLFNNFWEEHSSEEMAVKLMFSVFANNPRFYQPTWWLELCVEYREELVEWFGEP